MKPTLGTRGTLLSGMMLTWGAICLSPSTLTIGPDGVCAMSGGAAAMSANEGTMILNDACMRRSDVLREGCVFGRTTDSSVLDRRVEPS
jgi:hypothetical protein